MVFQSHSKAVFKVKCPHFCRGHTTLHLAVSVGRSVCPSVRHIFEFWAVFALLLLLNHPRLRYLINPSRSWVRHVSRARNKDQKMCVCVVDKTKKMFQTQDDEIKNENRKVPPFSSFRVCLCLTPSPRRVPSMTQSSCFKLKLSHTNTTAPTNALLQPTIFFQILLH